MIRALLGLAATLLACTPSTPPIGTCADNEHECVDHKCCLEGWWCGGDVESCPADSCCYEEDNPPLPQRHREKRKR